LRNHPLQRALRIDKLSLAALEATLRLYDAPTPAETRVPALRMLAEPPHEIERRARLLVRRLHRRMPTMACTLRAAASLAGGGSLPGEGLPTTLVLLTLPGVAPAECARRLRAAAPAVVGRIVDECFALDLRTVSPAEIDALVDALVHAAQPALR
jgi:L-seryl-tRNA(Ser) seleniumtransferase